MSSRHASHPPGSSPFPPGTVLAGKYRVERLLGEGGMGWVVEATHLHLDQRVALKFMHTSQVDEHPGAVGRFLREARAAARVQGEHVARVSDVGTLDNGSPYLVMEYLEGQDLDQLIAKSEPLSIPLVVDYTLQACEGLAEAHAAGIVHRDLKPANLFLAKRSDGSLRVKLLDFGISKMTARAGSRSDAGMTNTQALMGSPLYMSPEQLRSSKNVDRRTDLWSMGVILYELLAGKSPFDAETLPMVCAMIMAEPPRPLRSLRPEVPPGLEAVVLRCLDKEPARRYGDAAALAQALAPFGGPEAQAAAQRVSRLVLASRASMPDLSDAATSDAVSLAAASNAGKTNAAFTHSAARPRRSRVVPLTIVAVVAGLGGGVLTAALVVGRGNHVPRAIEAAPSTLAPTAASASATIPPPVTLAAPTIAAVPDPAPPATTDAPARTVAAAPTPPPRPTFVPTGPKPKPQAATVTAAPRPTGTSGFGGRE